MKKTPLQFWTDHKEWIQEQIGNLGLCEMPEDDGTVRQSYLDELKYADEQLEAIAKGTYEEPQICHEVFTIEP